MTDSQAAVMLWTPTSLECVWIAWSRSAALVPVLLPSAKSLPSYESSVFYSLFLPRMRKDARGVNKLGVICGFLRNEDAGPVAILAELQAALTVSLVTFTASSLQGAIIVRGLRTASNW